MYRRRSSDVGDRNARCKLRPPVASHWDQAQIPQASTNTRDQRFARYWPAAPGPRESRGVLRFGRDQPSLAWHEQYLLAEWVFWRERHSGIEKVFRGRRRAKPLPRGRRRERASRSWAVVTTDHEAPARNRRPHQDRPSQSMERTE